MQTRTVTMTNFVPIPPSPEYPFGGTALHQAVDHVPDDDIPHYVTEAQRRWSEVTVSDGYDPEEHDYLPPAHIDRSGAGNHANPGEVL